MDHMDFELETKDMSDNDGTFTGYASVFDIVDQGRDVVKRGAFKASLKEMEAKGRKFPILWAHDTHEPVGFWESLKEDDRGLIGKGRLLIKEIQRAGELWPLMKQKAVTGLSIGFRTIEETIDRVNDVRSLDVVKLMEASLVMFPMLDEARVVKNVQTRREFEAALREPPFNFPAAMAKSVATRGFMDDANGRGHATSKADHQDGGALLGSIEDWSRRMLKP